MMAKWGAEGIVVDKDGFMQASGTPTGLIVVRLGA